MDAGVAALIGAGIGLLGAAGISKTERHDTAVRERRQAFAAYTGALYPVVAELRGMPPKRSRSRFDEAIERLRGPDREWVASETAIAELGGRPHALGDRLAGAFAQIQVLDMPEQAMDAVRAANDYVERLSADRAEAVKAEWPAIHTQLDTATRSLGKPKRWIR